MMTGFFKTKRIRALIGRCMQRAGIFLMIISTIFYSFGGLDLYLGLATPFAAKQADAAYTGKQLRTIEYILGDGSENTAQGSGVISYAGSSWNTTKATAGRKSIVIEGTGIRVVSAYLDASFQITTSVNLTALDVFFDAQKSASAGSDVRVGELAANTAYAGTGLSGYIRGTHDVTSFFATTTDANWSAGVGVVAAASSTFSAASSRSLTTIKLVLTYEEDVSTVSHSEVKTVRFPLASSAAGDTGTRQTQCGAAATCAFTYTANIADAVADADILDVYFELHAQVDSGVASTFQPQISGGTAGAAFAWTEALADNPSVNVTYRPPVGGTDFARNSAQTLNVVNGLVPLNVLGGELVVTYRYLTGAVAQTETVRYYVNQDTTSPGVASSTLASTTVTISNTGKSVKNIWYRVHTPSIAAASLIVGSEVGTTTKRYSSYTLSGTNRRGGDAPIIVHNMSADIGNFWNTSVTLGGETRATVSDAPVGVEVFVTFTWDGNTASDVTKSVSYPGSQQGVTATANVWNNRPVFLELPETVTKTYRSAFLFTNYLHSNAAVTIALGTVTIGVNASTTAITENGDTEAFNARYLTKIASSTLSNGNSITWTTRAIEVNEQKNVANMAYFANEVIITYDAALGGSDTTLPQKQLRTVEYMLGDGSDNTPRGTGVASYAGSVWGANKAGGGTKSIVIEGTNIRVVNAYLEVGFIIAASVNMTNMDVFIDVPNSSSAGTDAPVGENAGVALYSNTGLTGYYKGTHDVTAFFSQQTDANWSAGVGVVAAVTPTFSGASNRALTNMRLVITYEYDYNLVAHNEVKTVRFPLDATVGGDTGSKTTACLISNICSFTYTSDLPDAAADADILDVYFDTHAEVNSGTAAGYDFQITSMPSPSVAYNWNEGNTDDNTVNILYKPPIGGTGFQRNVSQTLNIDNGAVALSALGGELVVTYRYSTGSASQTETVRYFMSQSTTSPSNLRSDFATLTPTISNGGKVMKDVWYKIHAAPWAATNMTIYGKVGTTTQKSNTYTFAATNPRAGDTPTIIYNMSADIGNYFAATTTLAGAVQFSVNNAASPISVEAYMTYVWSGSLGGTTTRSVLYSGAQQGVTNNINTYNNRAVRVELPEGVLKTYRSVFVETNILHSNAATTISLATTTFTVSGATSTVAEIGDTEAFNAVYLTPIASSSFSSGDTISFKKRYLEVSESKNVANYEYFNNVVVATYDAVQDYKYPTFAQNLYHFYVDNGAITPADAWPPGATNLGENTEITAADTPLASGSNLRLRMSLTVATTTMLASSTQFKLQYAPRVSTCGAISSWSDLGAPGSGSLMRGFNGTPADGSNLSTLLLSASTRAGLYQESNNTVLNPFAAAVAEDVEYDWNIQNNGAATDTAYCFRMTKGDGSPLYSYSPSYPALTTAGYAAEQKNWRWYSDPANETPVAPMAGQNTAPVNIANGTTFKLRVTLSEINASDGVNQKFRLQFSTVSDFSSGVTELTKIANCNSSSQFCYADGVDIDDSPISTLVLTDSTAKGRHNEIATSTSTMHPVASTPTEFEYTIQQQGASVNTTYYFRLFDNNHNRPVPLASLATYPSLSTDGTTLTLSIAGLASGVSTGGITTDVTTTPTSVPFGTIPIGSAGVKAAQRFTVSTNATQGYSMFVKSNGALLSQYGTSVPDVIGTNASPLAWATACLSSASGCFGYHTTDASLSGGSTRFVIDDTYAKFATTTQEEVLYNAGAVNNDVNDIIYRVEAHQLLSAGAYTTAVQYILVPIF